MERDLPALVRSMGENHPGLEIRVAPPLDGHPGLVAILADRFRGIVDRGHPNNVSLETDW
jgi:sirohydrochlorin ferrochelatase